MLIVHNVDNLAIKHQILVGLASVVLVCEISVLIAFREQVYQWLSHNLWIVFIPFTKVILKHIVALNVMVFLKSAIALLINLSKLFVLKFLKTLGLRYGIFFSQNRWRWIRQTKILFLRRGKQFFRATTNFWSIYSARSKWLIAIAFSPLVAVLFLVGLSFNITRRTMLQKTQEAAVFQMATSASSTSRGLRAWIAQLDRQTLDKIRDLTPRARAKK